MIIFKFDYSSFHFIFFFVITEISAGKTLSAHAPDVLDRKKKMQICTEKLMSRCIKTTGVNAQITSISCTQDQIPLVQLPNRVRKLFSFQLM